MPAQWFAGTGVLVLRAWVEDHPTAPLRVRITETAATGGEELRTVVVLSTDEACAIVRDWLDGMLASG